MPLLAALCGCQGGEEFKTARLSSSQALLQAEGSMTSFAGYLVYESHARQLWRSKSAYKNGDTESCITLVNTSTHHKILTDHNRKIVRIIGKLRHDVTRGYVDLGACNKTGVEVTSVQQA